MMFVLYAWLLSRLEQSPLTNMGYAVLTSLIGKEFDCTKVVITHRHGLAYILFLFFVSFYISI